MPVPLAMPAWQLWAWEHPFLVLFAYLCVEALLPVRFQPSAWIARGAIRAYQLTLSPLLGGACKFHPSCSHYGLGCVRTHGTLKGGVLTTLRLIRCSPLTDGGVDPVPDRPGSAACPRCGVKHPGPLEVPPAFAGK